MIEIRGLKNVAFFQKINSINNKNFQVLAVERKQHSS